MDEIVENILLYLKDTGWDTLLWYYFRSSDFEKIISYLREQVREKKRFSPPIEDMFYWLKRTPFHKITCVLFIENIDNGIDKGGMPTDFKKILIRDMSKDYKEFFNDKTGMIESEFDDNVERWCDEGVLFFPYACTCRVDGKPHNNIWTDFRARIIEIINLEYKSIPWVLINHDEKDTFTHKYEELIESKFTLPVISCPLYPITWYKWVNNILLATNKKTIKWAQKKATSSEKIEEFIDEHGELNFRLKLGENTPPNDIKMIVQIDQEGKVVKEHENSSKATRETGINNGGISKCLAGKSKMAGGYRWMYLSEYNDQLQTTNSSTV